AARLTESLAGAADLSVGDLAHALASSRSRFDHRAVVTASGNEELLAGLGALAAGRSGPGVVRGVAV
ncbi:hypothetical protein, partial [Streptomyces sp. NRRL WC-3549]|uniref:CurL C-terminal domain-containing protein n=1 Tax=Streptomyces sp. NRRL WC-3549 TaxID=1463925 RepID=UPI003B63A54D